MWPRCRSFGFGTNSMALKTFFFFEPPIWQSNMTTMGIGYGFKTEKLTYMEHENDVVFKSHEQLKYPDASAHLYGFCTTKFDS